jgi:hypothetical protein
MSLDEQTNMETWMKAPNDQYQARRNKSKNIGETKYG